MARKRDGDRVSAKRKRTPSETKPAPGMPNPKSVIAEETFISPKGNRYRILTTTETDPYDPPLPAKKRRP